MAKKDKLLIGVDIGSHAIKVCQLQRFGNNYKLITAGSALLPTGAVEDGILQDQSAVVKVLSSLLKNLKIKNRKIGISISGYSVIVKKINIEKMDDEALENYINAEAEQYIPFDINDVYIDYQKLPPRKEGYDRSDIMLVAAKKEVVDDYIAMLSELKLTTSLVDVDGFALENIWETVSGQRENVALIDIGASKMNINILSEGISVLARDVVVGSEQLTDQLANVLGIDYTEAEKIKLGMGPSEEHEETIKNIFNQTCTQWVLEIKKAVDLYFANNPDRPLKAIILSGGGSKVNGLRDYISRETGLEAIAFNPFASMICDDKKIDPHYLATIGPEMAIAAGLAIRTASI